MLEPIVNMVVFSVVFVFVLRVVSRRCFVQRGVFPEVLYRPANKGAGGQGDARRQSFVKEDNRFRDGDNLRLR